MASMPSMPTTATQEFATALVRRYAYAMRQALSGERVIDAFHAGIASVVLTAVQSAYGFTVAETESFVRIIMVEE